MCQGDTSNRCGPRGLALTAQNQTRDRCPVSEEEADCTRTCWGKGPGGLSASAASLPRASPYEAAAGLSVEHCLPVGAVCLSRRYEVAVSIRKFYILFFEIKSKPDLPKIHF